LREQKKKTTKKTYAEGHPHLVSNNVIFYHCLAPWAFTSSCNQQARLSCVHTTGLFL